MTRPFAPHTPKFSFFLVCRSALVLWLLAGWVTVSQASDFNRIRTSIEDDLAVFHLDDARKKIKELKNPGYEAFYETNILVYKFISTQEITYLQEIRKIWKDVLAAIATLPDTDPLKEVMVADLYGKRGGLEFLDHNYFTAIRLVRTSRITVKKNRNTFPDNVEQKKILGLFNVAFGAVPRKYQWITNTLGFRGDIGEGLKELEEAGQHSTMLRLESNLLLYYVEKNMLEHPEKALHIIQEEQSLSPDNILLSYVLATTYMSAKKNEEALAILRQRDRYESEQVFFIPFWDYLLGKSYYYKADHRNAQRYFSRFLQVYKGKLFRTDATFRLGMALTLDGSYPVGQRFFKMIAENDGEEFEEDTYAGFMAKKFLVSPPNPQVVALFRARNLYDGGYFEQAINILNALESEKGAMDPDERTELFYRYGRIHQAKGDFPQAIIQYQKCLQEKPTDQLWLQPYAHYYQGQMAEQSEAIELARTHYKQALEFDGYFYQEGLENRCKIALSELKKL